jgi:GNAT superfamily N-acetyltransferase
VNVCQSCQSENDVNFLPILATRRDRLYMDFSKPTDEWLCVDCRNKALERLLAFGWDIHNHPHENSCGNACPIKSHGRQSQRMAMLKMASDRKDLFLFAKRIDGQPRVNSSFHLSVYRLTKFLLRTPQSYYESSGDVGDLVEQQRMIEKLEMCGIPRYARPWCQFSFEVFEGARIADKGEIKEPEHGEKTLGLHSVVAEGVDPKSNSLLFWNSWGSGWGVNGYGSVSLAYLETYFHESWTISNVRWGPSPYKSDVFAPERLSTRSRSTWLVEVPMETWRVRGVRGESWVIERFLTLSYRDQSIVEILQLRNGYGLRVGWAHLRHVRGSRVSVIEELFVFPTFRNLGVGSTLESLCCEYAVEASSGSIHILLHEVESVVGPPRKCAREFGVARGYEWKWRVGTAPRTIATGTKNL